MSPSTKAYTDFLQQVEPVGISLNSCSAKIARPAFLAALQENRPQVNKVRAEYALGPIEGSHFTVMATVSLFSAESDEADKLLEVTCQVEAVLTKPRGTQMADLDRFAQSEARLIIWPYVRELVSSLTARMSIPPVTLPLVLRARPTSAPAQRGRTPRATEGRPPRRRRASAMA